MTPEEIVSRLLYRDGLMLIIDKPAGWPCTRARRAGASLEDDFDGAAVRPAEAAGAGAPARPETSGCLVLGRHRKALANLTDLFRHGKVGKTYWAVVEGGPEEPTRAASTCRSASSTTTAAGG